ncbi:MAG: CoA-binding protein [Desulfurivibrio sp.]|nr:CoA-binding protein [Desulfurivibrio sp.]
MLLPDLSALRQILQPLPATGSLPVIAVVGLSPKAERPSNQVARYLLARGFRVIPINPGHRQILERPCYASLTEAVDVEGRVAIVVIFRRAEQVLPVVREAVAVGATTVWLQEGIVHQQAAAEATAAGLQVVMDKCIKIVHQDLFG